MITPVAVTLPPTDTFPATPAPPRTTNAPDAVEYDCCTLFMNELLVIERELNVPIPLDAVTIPEFIPPQTTLKPVPCIITFDVPTQLNPFNE